MPSGKIDWESLLARNSKKELRFERMIPGGTVSGLVVTVGVIGRGEIPDDVLSFVRGLGGTADAAYRLGEDEFSLVWREERGAAAQQRLALISRELWDFQLGSLGGISILFSWGGVEVENESVEEAIAMATMRMQETRRGRMALMTREIRAASACPAALPS